MSSLPSRPRTLPNDARFTLRTLGAAALYRVGPGDLHGDAPAEVPLVGKQFGLLAYLACAPDRSASRDTLLVLFAPDRLRRERTSGPRDAETKSADAVRNLLQQLRSKLGHDALGSARSDPVPLTVPLTMDRDEFLDAWHRHDWAAAVDAYGGDFLPRYETVAGTEFAHWVETERSDLRRRFAHAARQAIAREMALAPHAGAVERALSIARRFREHDERSQAAWQFLIRSLVLCGQHNEALLEADRFREWMLLEQLDPDPESRAVLALADAESRHGTRSDRLLERAQAPTAGQTSLRTIVARDTQVAAILSAWERARSGKLIHFHVVAPAGFGKSRLLADLRQRLRARPADVGGVRVVQVNATPSTRDAPNAFIADVARAIAERPGALGIPAWAANVLVSLSPALADKYKAATGTARTAAAAWPHSVEAALQELIAAVALEGPLALFLDDLHWSDSNSLRVLGTVLHECATLPLLVVSAARDGADLLRASTSARLMPLHPFDADAIGAALAQLAPLPQETWATELPARLLHSTGGSPLVLVETLRLLADSELLVPTPSGWMTPDPDALFATLAQGGATQQRLAQLSQAERQLLLFLGVAPAPVSSACLRAAAGQPLAEFNASLTALERRGFAARDGDDWVIAHDEQRTTILSAAGEEGARRSAIALARAILDEARDDPRVLRRAGPLLVRGGDRTLLRNGFARFVHAARVDRDTRAVRALAHEFLGADAEPELVSSCAHQIPIGLRLHRAWRSRAAIAAAVVALISLAGLFTVGRLRAATSPPDAVLAARRIAPDGKVFEAFTIPFDASHWAGVSVKDVRLSGRPLRRAMLLFNGGTDLRPDHQGWTSGVSVPDSGVIDIYEFDLSGHSHRLTYTKMDDLHPSWAPDNSRFVFVTARWSQRGHYDLAIYDTLTHGVRHLTAGDDTDEDPHWSPDGSRIAFVRREAGSWRSRLCVIDAGGDALRCLNAEGPTGLGIAGWADAHRIWLRRGSGGDSARLERVDVETQHVDASDTRDDAVTISPDARFGVCACPRPGYPPGTSIVFPLERPDEFAVLKPAGVDPATIVYEWAPSTPRLPYVARIQIDTGLGPPLLHTRYQLRALGRDTSDAIVAPGVVRWRSEDTTVASIDSTGFLVPHRTGRVTIEASAGGWRTTRTTLTIGDATPRVLLDERWANGLTSTWTTHGIPKPIVVPDARFGHAFLNNGDGSFFSGAYTTRAYPTRAGLWVEATLSTPLTARESQEQVLWLFSMSDSAAWARWDHITGDGPIAPSSPGWSIRYPLGVNTDRVGQQLGIFGVSQHVLRPVPRDAYTGRPFTLVMQILPDGRCGVAVDGKVVWVGPAEFLQPSVRLMLSGNSVDTRILIGPVRIATGIAPGIEWSRF